MILYNNKLHFYFSTLVNDKNFFSGFSTKKLGDGRKLENILKFLKKNKVNFKKIIIPKQIHGSRIREVSKLSSRLKCDAKSDSGQNVGDGFLCRDVINHVSTLNQKGFPALRDYSSRLPLGMIVEFEKTDGLITQEKVVVLRVLTADCVPLILIDKKAGIVAASHQGWKGTYNRMSVKMINTMIKLGSHLNDIKVAIGPSISDCCYDIKQDRYKLFAKRFPEIINDAAFIREDKIYLNLAKLNYLQLIKRGLKKENIDFFPFCTACNKEKFFSYRRDSKESFGEMFSFILMI